MQTANEGRAARPDPEERQDETEREQPIGWTRYPSSTARSGYFGGITGEDVASW